MARTSVTPFTFPVGSVLGQGPSPGGRPKCGRGREKRLLTPDVVSDLLANLAAHHRSDPDPSG
jgi:hypothetical protein